MNPEMKTALIAGGVALVTAVVAAYSASHVAMTDARTGFTNDAVGMILQKRVEVYPSLFRLTLELSTRADPVPELEDLQKVGHKVNAWLYGDGGLFASAHTRDAASKLRSALLDTKEPVDLSEARDARNTLIVAMRSDLALEGDLRIDKNTQPPTEIQLQSNRLSDK